MTEKWHECLDENRVVAAVLMDLSKAFDSLPHDILIAKLHAHGFNNETLMLLVSYLTGSKQCVKNHNMFSFFKQITSGVPHGSVLGPMLFNIFINDILVILSTDDIHNFADDNTITAVSETIQDFINALQNIIERAIKWMENNDMTANPDKFKAIILTKDRKDNSNLELIFCDETIKTSNKVQLLGITIDQRLSFDIISLKFVERLLVS